MLKLLKGHPLKTRGSQSGQEKRTGTDKYRCEFSSRFFSSFQPGLKAIWQAFGHSIMW